MFLGSSCIYPKMASQPLREEYLLTGLLEPTNEPYAIAKIAGIKLCEAYHDQYGCNFISAMPTNLYGSGDNYHKENAHVIPALLRRFHEAKIEGLPEVQMWGTGKVLREFLHVDDLAQAGFSDRSCCPLDNPIRHCPGLSLSVAGALRRRPHWTNDPPSMTSVSPVIQDDLSLTRNRHASAMSCAFPKRCNFSSVILRRRRRNSWTLNSLVPMDCIFGPFITTDGVRPLKTGKARDTLPLKSGYLGIV